jgi:hypothetical protein
MVYIKFCGPTGRLSAYPLAISPANKAEFLRERAERVPGLRVLGATAPRETPSGSNPESVSHGADEDCLSECGRP